MIFIRFVGKHLQKNDKTTNKWKIPEENLLEYRKKL